MPVSFQEPVVNAAAATLLGLTSDSLKKIASYLDKEAMQSLVCVNKALQIITIEAANYNEPCLIKAYIAFPLERLSANINKYRVQRDQIAALSNQIETTLFPSLRLLRTYILGVKSEIINTLATLDGEMAPVVLFEGASPSNFLEDTKLQLDLRILSNLFYSVANPNERGNSLLFLVNRLCQAKLFDWAEEVSNSMIEKKDSAKAKIALYLAEAGLVDKALAVAYSIDRADHYQFNTAIAGISRALVKSSQIERALALVESITDVESKSFALKDIANQLAQSGDFRLAHRVVSEITDQRAKGFALNKMAACLATAGHIEEALDTAYSVPYAMDKKEAFDAMFSSFDLYPEGYPRMKAYLSTKNAYFQESIYAGLATAFALRNHFDTAIEMAHQCIPSPMGKDRALSKIAEAISKTGDFDRAISVANSIMALGLKDDTLSDIRRERNRVNPFFN
ncbi:MAG: hypothetical protein EBZ47_08395 [Chlamydiae bacterium]|nr:hypothetical protein [Chlamydiota bacterium]